VRAVGIDNCAAYLDTAIERLRSVRCSGRRRDRRRRDRVMPERIQLRRTKGWRKPEGAVVVAHGNRVPCHADVLLELANQ